MSRSTETNKLIKALFAEGYLMKLHDGEESYKVKNFKEAANGVDSVDDSSLIIFHPETKKRVGSVYIILFNEGEEQIADWSWNETEQGLAFNEWMDKNAYPSFN